MAIHQLPTHTPASSDAEALGAHLCRVSRPAAQANSATPDVTTQGRGAPSPGGISGSNTCGREHAAPDFAETLHLASESAAGSLDLARGDAVRLQGLEAGFMVWPSLASR